MAVRKLKEAAGETPAPKTGRPDRADTKCISAHLPAEMYWQLKALSVEDKTDMQGIIAEAINTLFAKRHKPTVPLIREAASVAGSRPQDVRRAVPGVKGGNPNHG